VWLAYRLLCVRDVQCGEVFYYSYAATSPWLTFKDFKIIDFLKLSDFNEALTNSLMMIY